MKKIIEKMDDIRWNMFGVDERLDKLEKNIYGEYRERLQTLENWMQKILNDEDKYQFLNQQDIGSEKEKYMRLYDGDLAKWYMENKGEFYGTENIGNGIIKYLKKVQPGSILDVGCGDGTFCVFCKGFIKKVYGLDIASVATKKVKEPGRIKYIDSDLKYIPLEDNEVEWTTAFDVMEHIAEVNVERSLRELDRVSTAGMIFSISYDKCDYNGEIMHKTIRPQEWWVEKIKEFGDVRIYGETPIGGKYILCLKDVENG